MKKNYILLTVAVLTLGAFTLESNSTKKVNSFVKSHYLFSSGGQSGLTGAPGEMNCTQCHSGSVLAGAAENQFTVRDSALNIVTSYIPGKTYTASLQLASNPAKKGFSSTALDFATNSMAGSFIGAGIGGTQNFQASSRDYVSHTSSSNTNSVTTWAWTWIAPATDVGDVVFYLSSNKANDDGSTAGDEIYLSQHTITSANTVGFSNTHNTNDSFSASYNREGSKVNISFNALEANDMFFNLIDLNGKTVYTQTMAVSSTGNNKHAVSIPQAIENGIYIVNFFNGNKPMSAKIMIQK